MAKEAVVPGILNVGLPAGTSYIHVNIQVSIPVNIAAYFPVHRNRSVKIQDQFTKQYLLKLYLLW